MEIPGLTWPYTETVFENFKDNYISSFKVNLYPILVVNPFQDYHLDPTGLKLLSSIKNVTHYLQS